MKKISLTFLTVLLISSAAWGGDYENKGVISGWKFTPVQIDYGFVTPAKLFDESSDTVFSFGVFLLRQKSAVVSVAMIANTLQNNYGIQINPCFLGTATDTNYGISLGVENFSKKCYGLQLGVLTHSFAGEPIEKYNERVQILGMNIADTLFVGLVNFTNEIQIGLFNFSRGAAFQLGLLNYNPKSLLPWLPIVNWNME